MGGTDLFKPTLERFKEHPGAAQKGDKSSREYWEPVPAPVVTVREITRGKKPAGSTCDDAGVLSLAIDLPPTSTYDIKDFAIYFRVLEGVPPDEIFPNIPLVGRFEGKTMTLVLPWLDGAPARQKPLDLKIEAFLMTNGLNIGASTTFEVKAPVGQR